MSLKKGHFAVHFIFPSRLLVLLFLVVSSTHASEFSKKNLLLIYSYNPTFETTGKIFEGLRSGLGNLDVNIDVEFMDSKSVNNDITQKNFHTSLKYKLSTKRIYDAVVLADDNALLFGLKHQQELFLNIPMFFLGVNDIDVAIDQNQNPFVTGVVEAVSIDENIEAVIKMLPNHTGIAVVSDGTTSGKADMSQWNRLKSDYPDISWITLSLDHLTWQEYKTELNSLNPNTNVLLLLSAYRDAEQVSKTFKESLYFSAENTEVPIVHPYVHGLGDGVLGGVVISHKKQAYEVGLMVAKHFSGVEVHDIPVLENSPNIPMFDERQLSKHNISPSSLPNNAIVLFQEKRILDTYSLEINFILLTLTVVLLAYSFIKSSKAKLSKDNERKLQTILDSIDIYIYLKDTNGRYLFANRVVRDRFGLTLNQVKGKKDSDLYDVHKAKSVREVDELVLKSKEKYSQDEVVWSEDLQQHQTFRTTKVPLLNDNLTSYAICCVSFDITEQKRQERMLEQTAYYDVLTGVANRILFMDRLKLAIGRSRESGNTLFVALFDIDDFKSINEQYGHDFGDAILKKLASRIQKIIEKEDVLARLGGDEFHFMFESKLNGHAEVELVQSCVSRPFNIDGIQVDITASTGVTQCSTNSEPEHLIRQAEQALYIAKSNGKNQVQYFSSNELRQYEPQRLKSLLSAFSSQEFVLYYQPKVSLTTGEVVGVEALIRWNHPIEGLLSPAEFLDDIEKYDLIKALDDWVFDEAIRQANQWFKKGIKLPVSINASHEYFRQKNIADILKSKLELYPEFPSSLIEIEIVESNALENLVDVANTIRSCSELDILFSLDDFGTGYSSLTYLQQLPVSTLKVDRSFVIDMLTNVTDRRILEGILGFCRAFNLTAVAEGVESLEHGRVLKSIGYDVAQGYGIAKPMNQNQFLDWLGVWVPPLEWNLSPDQVAEKTRMIASKNIFPIGKNETNIL
ncbi:putative Diguanylate cyclase [Vibrio coralliirubri]|uniref:GGDEF and EAL domain-containing protein n=1 Tax=Vibrio coralliirubri TaxID=1516159 RepID=UPI000632A749|nr:GGDEF and EAL domain-containing protein [Vibrio coralliirubri]CDT33977.1 putative Diguanylate cyclase [Vibrio coralliirubri]